MFEWMGRNDCRVAVNCAFRWRGYKCGFVSTGGPTHTSRGVIENIIGASRFPRYIGKVQTPVRKNDTTVRASFAIELEMLARKARNIALYADIWIVWAQTLRSQTMSTDAESGRVMRRATLDPWLDTNRRVLVGFFKLHSRSAMNTVRCQQIRTQPLRNSKYLPNGCVKWHNSRCRKNFETIDIEQLLRQLLLVDTEFEETEQPTSEAEEVDDRASGNVA